MHSYDVTGYPDIAKECLEFFAKSQKPDGNFLSQSQQYDGWGEAVWGYAQHYRITHDKAFAEWALPQIARAVDWLHQARAADPLHIIPASDVRDNEFVPGHFDRLQLSCPRWASCCHPDGCRNGACRPGAKLAGRVRQLARGILQGARCAGRRTQRIHSAGARRANGRIRLGQPAERGAGADLDPHDRPSDSDAEDNAGQIRRRHYDLCQWRVPAPLPDHQEHHDGDDSWRPAAGDRRVLCDIGAYQRDQCRLRVQHQALGRPQL